MRKNIQGEVEKILGFEIVEVEPTDAELTDRVLYNEKETLSIETLTDETFYVLSRIDENSDWEMVGYFREVE